MLYRYDLEVPPAEWDGTYKSIEYKYDTHISHLKVKNVVGAHFFFENRETAYLTGCAAAKKHSKTKLWITETSIQEEVDLLDLTYISDIPEIIYGLDAMDINILTDGFNKYETDGRIIPFSDMRTPFEEWKALSMTCNLTYKDIFRKEQLFKDISNFWYNNIAYFNQLFTDFGNGETLKAILDENGYGGYRFRDSTDRNACPTICIFDNRYLSTPVHTEEIVKVVL